MLPPGRPSPFDDARPQPRPDQGSAAAENSDAPGGAAEPVGPEAAANADACGSMTVLINNFRATKDPAAAQRIFERSFERLIVALRRKLPRQADTEDLAAYALGEALMKLGDGKYPDLNDRHDFWLLLLKIGELRGRHEWRAANAECRDVKKTVRVGDLAPANDQSSSGGFELAGEDPAPEAVAAFRENFARLYEALDADLRLLLMWSLEGRTPGEIQNLYSQTKGHYVSSRTILRKRDNIRDNIEKLFGPL